ncbi:M20/M25/M40 family metallo-hydrolase [Actinosynnema sp. NPDC020468]|uniref:M20/M25/M40 family metallo-hydrolase n=1 Tax=Actinosynnema sp. NPDC020468 TaxID=3154488 RepID=UPI0033C731E2
MSRGQPGVVGDDRAEALLRGMLGIPSASYHEQRLAAFLADELRDLGFDSEVDAAGNVVGRVDRGEGPEVMLLGHIDTIPGDLPVVARDGRLYGRGAVDAKGPFATMVCAAARAVDFRGRLVVVGAVEEETPESRGATHVRRTHGQPDALVIGEPSGWSSIVLGYKGKLDLSYRVEVPATHPSNPEPKASELVVSAWNALLELLGPDAGHGSFDRPGATLTTITGELTTASAEFSVRTPPGFDREGLVARLRDRLTAGVLDVVNSVGAVRVGRNDPVVRALSGAIRAEGAVPSPKVKTATSDMNTLAETWAVPMATYGPGDSALDHSDDEHLALDDYFRGIRVLTAALTDLGRTAPAARTTATARRDHS